MNDPRQLYRKEAVEDLIHDGPVIRQVHPLWVRWAHWVNFPLILLMMVSGVMIYWANDVYTPFISPKFYSFFGLDHELALGLGMHFTFMWLFTINGILYFAYLAVSGEWRELVPNSTDFAQSLAVLKSEFGLGPAPVSTRKFNAAQRMTYFFILLMGAFATFTGLAIYKPVQLGWLRAIFWSYSFARLLHFLLAAGFLIFFVTHVTQVVRAGWSKFWAMVIGVETVAPIRIEKKKTIEKDKIK
jgi:thiosulfate reductase cytochrome b subunit